MGKILAKRVENLVEKVQADGSKVAIKDGDELKESDTIVTGDGASVILVFENGSTVKVGSATRLSIEEFKVDPLDEQQKAAPVASLKAEPTKSKTALNLQYGEMVGDVKKLNASSSYSIKTPVGAAGIRGTIFRIVFRPASNGKAFFTVSTLEGLVVMEGVTKQGINVPHDKEVVVEIDVPDNPSTTAAAPKVVTQDIPADTRALLVSAAQVISDTLQTTVIQTPPPPPPATQPRDPTPGAGG